MRREPQQQTPISNLLVCRCLSCCWSMQSSFHSGFLLFCQANTRRNRAFGMNRLQVSGSWSGDREHQTGSRAKAVRLYNRRLDKGFSRCVEVRDPDVRTALLMKYGTCPVGATSEALKAFKSRGLMPFSAGVFDSPEFSVLMGGLCLAKRMAMEEFHVVSVSFRIVWLACC
jgi:hypothetical protein